MTLFYEVQKPIYITSQDNLPYVGIPSGPLGPWRAGINYFNNYQEVMREGYQKVRGPWLCLLVLLANTYSLL